MRPQHAQRKRGYELMQPRKRESERIKRRNVDCYRGDNIHPLTHGAYDEIKAVVIVLPLARLVYGYLCAWCVNCGEDYEIHVSCRFQFRNYAAYCWCDPCKMTHYDDGRTWSNATYDGDKPWMMFRGTKKHKPELIED